jgi:hypothetical protein
VTLYFSPTGDPGSFQEVDPTGAAGPIIDPPVNPQTTDSAGGYGWDVEGGFYWYVRVEKPGFASQDSRVVFVPPEVTDLNVGLRPDSTPPPSPYAMIDMARGILVPLATVENDAGIRKAADLLERALHPDLWEDFRHLTRRGSRVFGLLQKALRAVRRSDHNAVREVVDLLTAAGVALVRTAIDDAVAAGGDPDRIAKARRALDRALEQIDKGRPDRAMKHLKKAWRNAQKALR